MVDNNIYSQAFLGIAQSITLLESFKDSKGVNVSNWVTQIIGNSPVGYAFTLKVTSKDVKPLTLKVAKNFTPVGGHRDCPTYLGLMRAGKFDNVPAELLSMLGYLACGLWLGKPLAIVNSGRGLILDRLFKELNLTDLSIVIHEFSTGGRDPAHDVELNFNEIKALVKVYSMRSERIKALPKREGHVDVGKLNLNNRAKVEMID